MRALSFFNWDLGFGIWDLGRSRHRGARMSPEVHLGILDLADSWLPRSQIPDPRSPYTRGDQRASAFSRTRAGHGARSRTRTPRPRFRSHQRRATRGGGDAG